MDVTKEMLFNVKQTWRFAKATEANNKERQTAEENVVKKGRERIEKI